MTNNTNSNDNSLRIDVLIVSIVVLSLSLIVVYNGYKEIVSSLYGKYYLSNAVRADIKYTFVPIVVLYGSLFFATSRRLPRVYLLIIHAFLINVMFSWMGIKIAIIINTAELLFIILLTASPSLFVRSGKSGILEILRSFYYERITNAPDLSLEIVSKFRYTTDFILILRFMFIIAFILLLICLITLTTGSEKRAEGLSTVVYLLLVVGTGIGFYGFLRYCHKES